MEHITLYFKEGSSDKVYQSAIEPRDGGCVVTFAYGRRGSTLSTGTKTQMPVSHEAAQRIFDKLVAGKTAKGYTPGEDGTPYRQTGKETSTTGVNCQLLNAIEETQLPEFLDDMLYAMQEKFDGRRLLIQKTGNTVTGINRLGLAVGVPEIIVASALEFPADFIMDGEAVGDRLHAFDLLRFNHADARPWAYRDRYLQLLDMIDSRPQPAIRLVPTAFLPGQKRAFLDRFRAAGKEGVVFKDLDAPYTPGRPASGGAQLKYKFCQSASFIVNGINGKRSVSLKLMAEGQPVPAGNVTIPSNHEIPAVGAVVEVRYLHAFPESGCIYQPVYLGAREDIRPEECVVNQLKFKPISAAA